MTESTTTTCEPGRHHMSEDGTCTECGVEVRMYHVEQLQRVRYSWVVYATSEAEAQQSVQFGVPEYASEKLTGDDTTVSAGSPITQAQLEGYVADIGVQLDQLEALHDHGSRHVVEQVMPLIRRLQELRRHTMREVQLDRTVFDQSLLQSAYNLAYRLLTPLPPEKRDMLRMLDELDRDLQAIEVPEPPTADPKIVHEIVKVLAKLRTLELRVPKDTDEEVLTYLARIKTQGRNLLGMSEAGA